MFNFNFIHQFYVANSVSLTHCRKFIDPPPPSLMSISAFLSSPLLARSHTLHKIGFGLSPSCAGGREQGAFMLQRLQELLAVSGAGKRHGISK